MSGPDLAKLLVSGRDEAAPELGAAGVSGGKGGGWVAVVSLVEVDSEGVHAEGVGDEWSCHDLMDT